MVRLLYYKLSSNKLQPIPQNLLKPRIVRVHSTLTILCVFTYFAEKRELSMYDNSLFRGYFIVYNSFKISFFTVFTAS